MGLLDLLRAGCLVFGSSIIQRAGAVILPMLINVTNDEILQSTVDMHECVNECVNGMLVECLTS